MTAVLGLASGLVLQPSYADTILNLGLQAGVSSRITPDGNVVVGSFNNGSTYQAFRWTAATGVVDLGSLGGDSYVERVASDGNVMVGSFNNGSASQAFRWASATGMVALGPSDGSFLYDMTSDGGFLVGSFYNTTSNYNEAFYWTEASGLVGLGSLGQQSSAEHVNADGSIIVGGYYDHLGQSQIFRWTSATGMVGLGNLGGAGDSYAENITPDGEVIIGTAINASSYGEPFRWASATGMVGLGSLGGAGDGYAGNITPDGNVIAGLSVNVAGDDEVFRWTSATGMVGLGNLGGAGDSRLAGMTSNGEEIFGTARNASGLDEAFRWTSTTGMVGLGNLGAGYSSSIDLISPDGNTVFGTAYDFLETVSLAFRWTQDTGMQSLSDVLEGNGVDMTGWMLSYVNAISDDASVLAGEGVYLGDSRIFIATITGLTTVEDLETSILPVKTSIIQTRELVGQGLSQVMTTARSALTQYFGGTQSMLSAPSSSIGDVGNSMSVTDIQPAAGEEDGIAMDNNYNLAPSEHRKAVFATGSFGKGQDGDWDNDSVNGTTGFLVELNEEVAVGMGILGAVSHSDLLLSGQNITKAQGLSLLSSYEGKNGFRLYGAGSVALLDVHMDRHYMNGGGIDSSSGDTSGVGYGAAIRVGYERSINDKISILPFLETEWSSSRLNDYTEAGGGIPAMFGEQRSHQLKGRVGAEVGYAFEDGLSIKGWGSYGHMINSSGNAVSVSVMGLNSSLDGGSGDEGRNWGEAGTVVNYRVNDKLMVNGTIATEFDTTTSPSVNATMGVVWAWN